MAGLCLLAVTTAGCGLWRGAVRPRVPTSPEALLAGLASRRAAITSLRARARLRAGLRGVWTREAILVRRPDAVRVDVLSPFGLLLALGTHDGFLWVYPTSEATRYEGPATPTSATRFLGAPVTVADLVDILLGVPPARVATAPPTLATARDGEYRLAIPVAAGVQTIWFAGDTLSVTRAEEVENGTLAVRVGFGDYRDGFPRTLDIEAPAKGTAARLAYDQIEPNVALDPAVFMPPPATRVVPLESAGASGAE